jgi:DNA replication protein
MLISDLVRIAAAGGGLRINCEKHLLPEIIRIASAASSGGGFIILENTSRLLTTDMVRIAAASKGHVIFNDLV